MKIHRMKIHLMSLQKIERATYPGTCLMNWVLVITANETGGLKAVMTDKYNNIHWITRQEQGEDSDFFEKRVITCLNCTKGLQDELQLKILINNQLKQLK